MDFLGIIDGPITWISKSLWSKRGFLKIFYVRLSTSLKCEFLRIFLKGYHQSQMCIFENILKGNLTDLKDFEHCFLKASNMDFRREPRIRILKSFWLDLQGTLKGIFKNILCTNINQPKMWILRLWTIYTPGGHLTRFYKDFKCGF